jgi:hypothetical protein
MNGRLILGKPKYLLIGNNLQMSRMMNTLSGLYLDLISGWAAGPIRLNLDVIVTPQFPSQEDLRKFMFNPFRASEGGSSFLKYK